MGKRRHAQDKMWITNKELQTEWGGRNIDLERIKGRSKMVKLPFDCCNISMAPVRDPYCTPSGIVFDLLNIVPILRKSERNPVDGTKLKQSDLIKLHFHKNEQGQYHCPVTYKQFTEHSHMVAVAETGNVYSFDAYKELNKEPQWYFDLLTNQKFDPKKLITIQDPKSPGRDRSFIDSNQKKETKSDPREETKHDEKITQSAQQKRVFEQLKQSDSKRLSTYEKERFNDDPLFQSGLTTKR
jgi:peptidyl-prolyl cis-trans isomerase-like 2